MKCREGGNAEGIATIIAVLWGPLLWGEIHTQKHALRHTDTCMQTQNGGNITQRPTATQWPCVVLLSIAVEIYWLLCGVPIHPCYKSILCGSTEHHCSVLSCCVRASAPPRLSSPPSIISGEQWEWLGVRLTPECWLWARSSVQGTASFQGGKGRGMQGAIYGKIQDNWDWARFPCKNFFNFLLICQFFVSLESLVLINDLDFFLFCSIADYLQRLLHRRHTGTE